MALGDAGNTVTLDGAGCETAGCEAAGAAEGMCAAGLAASRDTGSQETLAGLLDLMAVLDLRAGRTGDAAAHVREALQFELSCPAFPGQGISS